MSKRTAQGPQGSKEDENAFAMSSTPDEKPQRATAAQMANRKIKDIRKRPRAATPTGVAGSQPSGAFSSLSAAPAAPIPGFSAPPAQSNGFAFGQSQSFPGASPAPSQPNQGGSAPFSFGGSGSTGFNFSSGFGSSSANPFASNSFGAATSAPSQPAPSAGTTGFVGFGNQTPSQPPFSGGLFGAQQNSTAPAPSAPIFGQATTSSAANSVSESMQTSPDPKPKAPSFNTDSSSVQKNPFGGSSTSNLFSPKPAAAPTGNLFGGLSTTSTTNKPSSDKAEELAPKPAFTAQASTPTTQAQPFGALFGAPSTSSVSEPEKATTPQPVTTNPFAPKPTEQANNLFALKPVSSEAEKPSFSQPVANNIFSPQPTTGATATNIFAPKSTSQEPTPSTAAPMAFKPAGEQAPMSNLFAPKPAAGQQVSDKASEAQPFKPLFGGTSTAPTTTPATTPAATSGLFSQAAAEKPAENQPFKSLFGAPPTPSQPTEPTPALFAPKPAAAQTADKPASAQPFGSLFGSSTSTPKPSEPAQPQTTSAATPNLFSPKPTPSQPSGNMFGAKPPAPEPKAAQAPVGPAATAASAQSLSDRIPKPDFPASVSKEVTAETELVWKVRSLDHFFKQEILSYEPGTHAFDNLILFYMKARQALGAPVRSKGPAKLSNGVHTTLETPRQASASPAKQTPAINPDASATSSLFSQSFSSSPAQPSKADGLSQTKTSNPPSSTPAAKANPFASLSSQTATTSSTEKAPTTTASAASNMGSNMFAKSQTPGTQSVAPVPSIPKFGNGASGTDFMAQFKKMAEKTAAEEKAKRKAEDFDSDEDDEAEWERRDAEKQREKRAKLEAASKKKTVFIPGQGFKFVDADHEAPASSATSVSQPAEKSPMTGASAAPSSVSIFDSTSRPLSNSENIFGRLSATPQPAESGKDSDESDNGEMPPSPKRRDSDAESGDEGDFEAALRRTKRSKPSENTETSKSSLDTPLPAPSAAAGRSLFDRIQSPAPQNESATSNLFSASLNKATAAPSDNTWKPNSPIKFSSASAPPPAFAVAPTPTPASTQASGVDTTTSGDATPDEETAPGAIFDMTNANAGEEDEEVAFECRARAFKLATGWASQGTGVVRLLKHPATGRSRIVLRADPGGNVILNTLLKKEFDYSRANNSVQFMVPQPDNKKPEHWAIRVKAESIDGLHDTIQAIKN